MSTPRSPEHSVDEGHVTNHDHHDDDEEGIEFHRPPHPHTRPPYTRRAESRGWRGPEVLLSGNHQKIAQWRRQQSRDRTAARRKDLLAKDLPDEAEP